MHTDDPNMHIAKMLTRKGIRPTKIRKHIAELLFDGHNKHVTADDVIDMARAAEIKVSIASIYNTLNQFAAAGLLRRVTVDPGKTFFDTNLTDHHHFFYEGENRLEDITASTLKVSALPPLPNGRKVKSIDVTIRLI